MKKLKPTEIKNPKCDKEKILSLLFILRFVPLSFKREKNELNMIYICVIGANPKNPTKIFHVLILLVSKKWFAKKHSMLCVMITSSFF